MDTFLTIDDLNGKEKEVSSCFNWRLGDILVEHGSITKGHLRSALEYQQRYPGRIGNILIKLGFTSESRIQQALMEKFAIPRIKLEGYVANQRIMSLVSSELASKHCVIPISLNEQQLFLAMADPLDWQLINQISIDTGLRVEPVMALSTEIRDVISLYKRCSGVMNIDDSKIEKEKEAIIPDEWVLKYHILPLTIIENKLFLAISRPHDKILIEKVAEHTGKQIEAILTPPAEIEKIFEAQQTILQDIQEVKRKREEKRDEWAGHNNLCVAAKNLGNIIKERFILESVLGIGSMGTVYKATDLRLKEAKFDNCFVALKILNSHFKDNPAAFIAMQREAAKTQMLKHPNIVTVNDFDRDGDIIYITMEYLEGQALCDHMRDHYPKGMPIDKVIEILEQLTLALDFAHQNNIIHCDFKPGNAFITTSDTVKVIDFGIARNIDIDDSEEILPGFTPSYASHELFYGIEPSPSDDVYALSVATYKMLTGNHPFDGHSAVEAERLGLRPQKVDSLSNRQWKALRKGLALTRKERTASVNTLLKNFIPNWFEKMSNFNDQGDG